MNGDHIALQSVCTKNRAEELGLDVWREFVVPLFFDKLDIADAAKPRVIVGGRGCGKTMLLRYLSHHSSFSPNRPKVSENDLRHPGLYWKVDTHFLGLLEKRGVEDHIWESAFAHFFAIVVCTDIMVCLENLAERGAAGLTNEKLRFFDLSSLRFYDPALAGPLPTFRAALQRRTREFQAWVNNPRKLPEPIFLAGKDVVLALIQEAKRQIPALAQSTFFLYIDEYENLREYQQKIVNTWLKHSEPPLIFNIATKRNGMKTRQTVGDESITDIADYRTHDLDDYLSENNFKLFAAEILFLRFATMAQVKPLPVNVDTLRDPEELANRRSPEYISSVVAAAQSIFPGLSQSELAVRSLADKAIRRKLEEEILNALKQKRSGLDPNAFIRPDHPEATIIVPALLARKKHSPEEILRELDALAASETNRFTGKADWIHNNFIGCLLQLYAPYNRACPFYAGFDTFVQLASLNLRYFLELCHKSLKRAVLGSGLLSLVVPPEEQAECARQASTEFLREVRTFGHLGNRLHAFVLTLGSTFAMANRRPTQSEAEINHFSVQGGPGVLDERDEEFFRESTKWSVLTEEPETKIKDPAIQAAGTEWILAPIYSPYFHISFRKRKRLDLAVEDVRVMCTGDYSARRDLLKKFMEKWRLGPPDGQRDLFANIEEDT